MNLNKCNSELEYINELIEKGVTHALVDVDNTIAKANITELYLFMRKRKQSKLSWYLWCIYFAFIWAPIYLLIDFIDRDLFQKAFYKRYRNFTVQDIESNSTELFKIKYKGNFIERTHDLIFHLKEKNIGVTLLSTNINTIVREYAAYFEVPFICLEVKEKDGLAIIDLTHLNQFKYRAAQLFNQKTTMAIADSKHDLPVLNYVSYSMVVSDKKKSWMKKITSSFRLIPEKKIHVN